MLVIEKDVSGIKIVLDSVNFSLPATEKSRELFNNPKIKSLYNQTIDNYNFASKVEEYLNSPVQSGLDYYKLMIELLNRTIEITPPEFTKETLPNPSFKDFLRQIQNEYDYYFENNSFSTTIAPTQKGNLEYLLNVFHSKIDNNLHFEILHQTLPIVLNDPLIKNTLQTTFAIEKGKEATRGERIKENGFQSIYYTLTTPFGEIELQSQSSRAYYVATKGSAYHSGIPGKSFDVKDFFELVDLNDIHTLDYYLEKLDSVSADSMVSESELPKFKNEAEKQEYLKTEHGLSYLESENYREMIKHIKIKDTMEILPPYLPSSLYEPRKESSSNSDKDLFDYLIYRKIDNEKLQKAIESGEVTLSKVDANYHLLSTALSISPYMNVASSGHSSFTTVGIHHKKVIGEFSEAIRKKDANTILRDLLIRRLENILDNPSEYLPNYEENSDIKMLLEKANEHEEIATKLPKDISRKNVFQYGEKLRQKQSDSKKPKTRQKSITDIER